MIAATLHCSDRAPPTEVTVAGFIADVVVGSLLETGKTETVVSSEIVWVVVETANSVGTAPLIGGKLEEVVGTTCGSG